MNNMVLARPTAVAIFLRVVTAAAYAKCNIWPQVESKCHSMAHSAARSFAYLSMCEVVLYRFGIQ